MNMKRATAIRGALAALLLVAGLAGCGAGSGGSRAPGLEPRASIEVRDYAYRPLRLTVQVGATVLFTNLDSTAHTATASSGAFDTGTIAPRGRRTIVLTHPGTYAYYCQFHPFMRATITVTP